MRFRTVLPLPLVAVLASALPADTPQRQWEQLAALVEQVDRGEFEPAEEALGRLLEHEGELPESDRARLQYARGLLTLLAEQDRPTTVEAPAEARDAFLSARALAGPGELRLAATYDAGVAVLESAERARAHLPELQEERAARGAPEPPPFASELAAQGPQPGGTGQSAGAAAPQAGEAPDALAIARAAYEEARELLLERLRADWRDADTRANLEWIERRLEELDRIQRQREEQQEQQDSDQSQDQNGDSQQDAKDSKSSKDSKNADGQKADTPKDPSKQDESDRSGEEEPKQDQQGGDREGQEDSSQSRPDDEQPGNPEDSTEAQGGEPQEQPEPSQPEEGEPREPKSGTPPQSGGEAHGGRPVQDESHLTHEEVTRLLDRLGEIEQRGEELQRALRRVRRVPVDRDW